MTTFTGIVYFEDGKEIKKLPLTIEETIKAKDKEIERLNNIINELEKALKDHREIKTKAHYGEYYVDVEEVYDYLQELKNNKKDVSIKSDELQHQFSDIWEYGDR